MNCQTAQSLIQRAIDGELPPQDESPLADHVDGCPACRAERDAQHRLRAAFAADRAALPQPPADLTRRVVERVTCSNPIVIHPRFLAVQGRRLAAAALVMALLGGAYVAGRRETSAGQSETSARIEEWRREAITNGADAAAVERLFQSYERAKQEIEAKSEREYAEAYERLSSGMEKLVSTTRAAPGSRSK
jgi:predicted anti-sigma-YlaC factor YlaD